MGWATLLLVLSLGAAEDPPLPLDAQVAEGRRVQGELRPLLDELAALRQSYAWERDGRRAGRRRRELRGRIEPLLSRSESLNAELSEALRRFGEERGLEAIELMALGKAESSPEVRSAMAAHTYIMGAQSGARWMRMELELESREWGRFALIDAERRSYRRMLWGLAGVVFALLAFLSYAVYASRRRRRRGPITVIPE